VLQFLGPASFLSIWYWVLSVTLWTVACHRTLGVPYDMVLRAGRLPQVAERVDDLAHITAERLGGIHDSFGVPLAALAGFVLAALAAIGFGTGIEVAQAAFMLAFPLAVVGYSSLRLALAVRRRGTRGAELRQVLARRRLWHQAVAVLALLAAAMVGLAKHPDTFLT
jgi:hypothetical protein